MKIIFFGLLLAVLVVFSHGDDSNEPANVIDMKQFIDTLKETIQGIKNEVSKFINEEIEINERKITKIEKYRKENVEGDKQLMSINAPLIDPNLSTEVRNAFQRYGDILTKLVRNSKWNEKRIEELHGEIRRSRQGLEQLNIYVAQFVNSSRRLIDSYPQYA